VQKLEQESGGQLIYRERQLTQLTDLGKEVLPMLERTLACAEAAKPRSSKERRLHRSRSAWHRRSASLLLGPITEIAKFLPGLRIELQEDTTEKLVDLLLGGEINAALIGDVQGSRASDYVTGADISSDPADVLGSHRTTQGYLQTPSSAAPKNAVETMDYKFRTRSAES
jgi:DNA-binding transcriptional LysR family regulator